MNTVSQQGLPVWTLGGSTRAYSPREVCNGGQQQSPPEVQQTNKWFLQSFRGFFLDVACILVKGCDTGVPFMAEFSKDTYSLHFDQL